MTNYLSYSDFESVIAELDWTRTDCMGDIANTRLLLEDAYALQRLSLHQWRVLWQALSEIRAKCALLQPEAWRFPAVEGSKVTYIPPPPTLKRMHR
jgi:hypothetical protein